MSTRGIAARAVAMSTAAILALTLAPGVSADTSSQVADPVGASESRGLSDLAASAGPTPEPAPIPLAAKKSVHDDGKFDARGPVVAASESAEPAPEPVLTWVADGKTDYQYLIDGFLRYERTPAAFIVPGRGRLGYEMRGFSGLPQIPSQNRGSDACVQASEGKLVKAPTAVPDWCGGSLSRQEMMCHLSPYGELVDDPLANYSYGTDWTVSVRYEIERLHIDGVPTGTTRQGRMLKEEYAVKWGLCNNYVYTIPFKDPYECLIEVESFTAKGPYGKGLPTVNNFTGETIPESETSIVQYDVPGKSPLGRAWNGGDLYGLGENKESIALVERCREWKAELPEAAPDYYGNWDYTVKQLMTTCTIIRYPGYGQSNFQGCSTPYTETNQYTKNARCAPGDPQGAPRIRDGRDDDLSFTPEAMGCFTVTCEWTYPGGEIRRGNGAGWPFIKQDKSDDIIIDLGAEPIRAYADGEQWRFQYPELNIATVASRGADATAVNSKWTLFEVAPGASPWNPDLPFDANSKDQWFFTESENFERVLTRSLLSSSYCVPGVDACIARGDVASIAGGEAGVPIYSQGPSGRRDFAYKFGINFYSASALGKLFSVQGLHQQRYRGEYAFPSTLTIMTRDVYLGGREVIDYVTISTCATGWTNMSVLRPRISP